MGSKEEAERKKIKRTEKWQRKKFWCLKIQQ